MAKNNFFFGIALALLATLFGMALVYVLKYMPANQSFLTFLDELKQSNQKKSAVIALSLLANLPLMYYCQQRKLWLNFKGISAVIITLGIIMISIKLNLI